MEAVLNASREIAVGDAAIAIAGGVESMTRAPVGRAEAGSAVRARPPADALDHARLADGQPAPSGAVDGRARRGRRDPRRRVRDQPRAAGRVRRRQPSARRRGVGRRPLRRRGRGAVRRRPRSATSASAPTPRSSRWRSSSRCSGRTARVTAGNVVADERRRRGACCSATSTRRRRSGATRSRASCRGRCRASSRTSTASDRSIAAAARPRSGRHRLGRPGGRRAQRGVRRPGAGVPGAVARPRPIDRQSATAARSRSATRSVAPAPASSPRSPTSCTVAAAVGAWRRCASVSGRASPSCSRVDHVGAERRDRQWFRAYTRWRGRRHRRSRRCDGQEHRRCGEGQAPRDPDGHVLPAHRRPSAARRRPGHGQDHARQGDRRLDRRHRGSASSSRPTCSRATSPA